MQMAYEKVVSHPPDDPAEALALLIRADVGYVRSVEDKRLWREMLGAATQAHDRAEDDFDSNKRMFTTYIEQLLSHYMSIGLLSSEIPISAAVDIVFAINAYHFRGFCADKQMKHTTMLDIVRTPCREKMCSYV